MHEPSLKRSLSLPLITLYGLGTMVGGGFYALLGEVSGRAGMGAPLAFLAAAVVALFSAFSFAGLSARFPVSAGEARYVREAFGLRWLANLVALLVIFTGVVSAATLANAIGGFLQDWVELPRVVYAALVVVILGGVAAWGITQTVVLATTITVIEVGGLVAILFLQGQHLAALPERLPEIWTPGAGSQGFFLASFLAFYAYVGFEDMVNVAEEVKDPSRNLPIAIFLALGVTTLLYVLVALVAVLAIPPAELAQARTPLARLVTANGDVARVGLAAISVLAGVNGALVQLVMAARVAYGVTKNGGALSWLAHVHPRTRTPVRATLVVTAATLVLALGFGLIVLAQVTSAVLLVVFALVNASLFALEVREPKRKTRAALWIPAVGTLLCLGFLLTRFYELAAS